MKRYMIVPWCVCLLVSLCGAQNDDIVFQPSYPQLKELSRHGGIATVNLTIRDDQGTLITGAKGVLGCWNGTRDEAYSDENGHLVLSATAFTDGNYGIEKDGYYGSSGGEYFEAPDKPFGLFERRRWKPVVKDMVLKKKRNPIPMYSKHFSGKIPLLNQAIGFDLKIVDWVKPYGKGEENDMMVTVTTKEVLYGKRLVTEIKEVTLEWPNEHDGVQVCDSDTWSDFLSAYHVDLKKPFSRKLILESGEDRYDWLKRGKYLVFRTRSETSPNGELIRCHYGKIYRTIDAAGDEFALSAVFFNPTPNDTNLEFDPKRNLSPFKTFEEEQTLNLRKP